MISKINHILGSQECEYFSIAFLYHVILIGLLALIVNKISDTNQLNIITIRNEEESIVEVDTILPEITEFSTETTSFSDEPVQIAAESSLNTNVDINIPEVSNIEFINDEELTPSTNFIGETISGVGMTLGKGLSNEKSTGGALDRLTVEIIDHAQTKNLNVVWLFDASISLNLQRQLIRNRFDKILEELTFAENTKEINHAICSFGESFRFITEQPTNDANTLKKDMDQILLDESGIENTFNAIGQTCKKYFKSGSRLMIIVFTDEIGDDISLLDSVSSLCSHKATSIYVVGSPAPFGKSKAQFKFVDFDPNYDQKEKWVEIQQGPETLYSMILQIKSLPIDEETLDSGFGSFALSKLCLDTGGIYFSVHPNRSSDKVQKQQTQPLSSYISRFFDHETMIKYKPDYRSYGIQSKEAQSHLSKRALIQAASIPLVISGEQTLRFKAFDEGTFVNELNMAQRFSAKLEPKIQQVYNALLTGESSYGTLEDRWKVSYALAMGRILATKCRIESYNLVLAEAKTGLKKKDPKTNIWILLPSKEFNTTNSVLTKNYKASQTYLKYVVDNFPNTPWSLIANEELNTPIGYQWIEHYEEPPKNNGGGGGNNVPKDDMAKPKLIPKPQRKIDKI